MVMGWFYGGNGWFRVVTCGYELFCVVVGWTRVVISGYGWLWSGNKWLQVVRLLMSGFGWLWETLKAYPLTTQDSLGLLLDPLNGQNPLKRF